jgi:uncharacterized iron-regulated membrane protein
MAWRWHFYAGLFVIPFLIMLSVTGTVMLYDKQIQSARYNLTVIQPSAQTIVLAVSTLIAKVQQKYPDAHIKKYMPPKTQLLPAFVVIKDDSTTFHIALNPYNGEILDQLDRNNSFYAWANDIHGSLLIGDTGDRLIEASAGLMLLLILSGLYMWWPSNNSSKRAVFWPVKGKGKRNYYRELHSALGFYTAIVMLFFIISGLAWAGVWGSKIVQPWSSFPMQKSSNVPLSTLPHSTLNQGAMEEMPWNLEQTKLPASDIQAAAITAHQKVSIDQVVAQAKSLNMQNYQLRIPLSEKAVYSLTANTMSGDITDPRLDRTVHIDQYSGKVLADIGWNEYSPMAKFMAAGIALHQGGIGSFNLWANTLLCVLMIIICITGIIIWYKRRPAKSYALAAPAKAASPKAWKLGIFTLAGLCILFPVTGVAIVLFFTIDSTYGYLKNRSAHQ